MAVGIKPFPYVLYALYLYGFGLPLSKSVSSILMGMIYAFTIAFACLDSHFRRKVLPSLKQPLLLPIVLYLSVLSAGLVISQDLREGLSVVKQSANLLLVYLMISAFLDMIEENEQRNRYATHLLFAFLMGILVLDFIGILTYGGAIGNKRAIIPVTPLTMHHIWFGNLNAIALLGAISLLAMPLHQTNSRKNIRVFLLWVLIPVAVFSLLFSASRTAWLGLLSGCAVWLYFRAKRKGIFFLTLLPFLAGVIAMYFASDIVHSRIDQAFKDIDSFLSGDPNTSLGARFIMWKASVSMFLSNPLFGVGTGDYKLTIASYVASGQYPPVLGKYNQPHNMYLFALATNGVVGLSIILFIFYKIIRHSCISLRQQNKAYGALALTITTHFLIAGLTESLFNIHVLITSFAVIMGIGVKNDKVKSK